MRKQSVCTYGVLLQHGQLRDGNLHRQTCGLFRRDLIYVLIEKGLKEKEKKGVAAGGKKNIQCEYNYIKTRRGRPR